MSSKKSLILLSIISGFFLFNTLSASTFFSGYSGAKLNYSAKSESKEYDPELKLQAFCAGQFNFSENLWSHMEISLDTNNLLSKSIFHETESIFQIDELSLIAKGNMMDSTNYFSLFMGTYDPIGSDVFLQRYFSIEKIASKITESYLGLAGSILYPHFGIGVSDIIKFNTIPFATGGYIYVNHEDEDYYVVNLDARAAAVFRYFTIDLAAGIGAPISDKYNGKDVIVAIDKLYWHAGTTMLLGNNYTQSLFIQAGLSNAAFTAKDNNFIVTEDNIYLLFEPRWYLHSFHVNTSFYTLPKRTVEKLLHVDDSVGMDLNMYTDSAMIGYNPWTIGGHISFSLIDKNIYDLADFSKLIENGYNVNLTPYIQTNFLSGELHLQAKLKIMEMTRTNFGNAFSVDLGYRTTF